MKGQGNSHFIADRPMSVAPVAPSSRKSSPPEGSRGMKTNLPVVTLKHLIPPAIVAWSVNVPPEFGTPVSVKKTLRCARL